MFDGQTFNERLDGKRLNSQLEAVRNLMLDGEWRTLSEISSLVPGTIPSLSARLRDLRKPKFGGYTIERHRVPNGNGLFQYRMIVDQQNAA